ncbi:MAG TPA: hypothetical protein DEO88_03860, partial [Syntrophobacteraceae bacterium]|nr:hypothetical protein [Syntrophobacteraceae bacterium]
MLPPFALHIETVVLLAAGILLALLIGWTLARWRGQRWLSMIQQQLQAEHDELVRKADEQERLLHDHQELTERLRNEQSQLQQALLVETEKRAGLAAQAERIPTLENALSHREEQLAGLHQELSSSRTRAAQLETELIKERESAAEKLATLL